MRASEAKSVPLPPPRRSRSSHPTFKVLLVGDAAVGKSNLLSRFANDTFDLRSVSTIGVEFVTREIDVGGSSEGGITAPPTPPSNGSRNGHSAGDASADRRSAVRSSAGGSSKINLQIWDTAGQERCGLISSAFYRGAKGVVVVYDVTRRQSLLNVPRWVAHAKQFAEATCVFMVVGNKLDLSQLREVKEEEAEEICHILGVRHYYASALTGDGVPTIFFQLALAVNAVAASSVQNSVTETPERSPLPKVVPYEQQPRAPAGRGDASPQTAGVDQYTIRLHRKLDDSPPRRGKGTSCCN